MREMVHAELHLVAVVGQPRGGGHDAAVAHEHIEAGCAEAASGRLDRDERGEVALEEGQPGSRGDGLGFVDERGGAARITAGEIDVLWAVLCES